jgi:hypothetical protein
MYIRTHTHTVFQHRFTFSEAETQKPGGFYVSEDEQPLVITSTL